MGDGPDGSEFARKNPCFYRKMARIVIDMKIPLKAYLFTVAALLLLTALVIYRYEKILKKIHDERNFVRVQGGAPVPKPYTAAGIIALIKSSKSYLGDSITIFENGEIHSSNGSFQ